jgi:hypothetical protein
MAGAGKSQTEARRQIAILREAEQAADIIRSGLAIYQLSHIGDEDHVVFLTLFASGFERFMKVLLLLRALEVDKNPLTNKDLKNLGHDLVKLKDNVVAKCYTPAYLARPIAAQDLTFIQSDAGFILLLNILNDFANAAHPSGRYNFINIATDPVNTTDEWPERRWKDELESRAGTAVDYLTDPVGAKARAVAYVVGLIEKFARALYRILVFSGQGSVAASISTSIHFESLKRIDDTNLGKRKYTVRLVAP